MSASSGIAPGIFPGAMLVASPALHNTPFQQAVVFVLQNNAEGTFGVVLNRPANEKIKYAWQKLIGTDSSERYIVHGGPIGGPVFAIHQEKSLGEIEMPDGIFVSAGSDTFEQLVQNDNSRYRIVFGIAGWQNGQLTNELEKGLWFSLDASAEAVFDDVESMWEKSLRRYGRQLMRDVVGINEMPADPLAN